MRNRKRPPPILRARPSAGPLHERRACGAGEGERGEDREILRKDEGGGLCMIREREVRPEQDAVRDPVLHEEPEPGPAAAAGKTGSAKRTDLTGRGERGRIRIYLIV